MASSKITKSRVSVFFKAESGYDSRSEYSTQNSDAMLAALKELAVMLKVEGRLADVEKAMAELREWQFTHAQMPTEADADPYGNVVWWYNQYDDFRDEGWVSEIMPWDPQRWYIPTDFDDDFMERYTHWQRTGLAKSADPGEPAHDLYETGDPEAPRCILDSNGEVVLDLCKRCGRGEVDLDVPCVPATPEN